MRLYNTLTRSVEDFKPIQPRVVKLYSCGPTVYDNPQLGNLRAYVFVDTLRRTLESAGFEVKHVMNITDVGHLVSDDDEGEDKLEKGAKREGKSVWDIAKHFTEVFKSDVEKLNILPPNAYDGNHDGYPRATEFIPQQINIVKILIDKGFAYQTEQAIYFDVTKLSSYGELTGQKLSEKETGARLDVITDPHKKHPQDFALWFFTVGRFSHHDMHWQSPWGDGFPGWHLECSAIIHTTLGDPIDIHSGGVDHIGTHHTNEMAQTEAAFGNKLANYWLHNEFMLVDSQRMGKSLGNFYTLENVEKKGYDPLSLRLLFLQAHYRSQLNFTWDSLKAADIFLKKIYAWSDLKLQPDLGSKASAGTNYQQKLGDIKQAMEDDLNSPKALSIVSSLITQAENEGVNIQGLQNMLGSLDELLGLELANRHDINKEQKNLIAQREEARKARDWSKADSLRKMLKEKGIEINDTEHGPVWSRF